MSRPRFLADEDLRLEIVLAVRRAEPLVEIFTVRELGRAGSTDAALMELAATNGWILISHDVNTVRSEAERRISDGRGIAGLFLVPQFQPTRAVADSILLVWTASDAQEWADRVVYLPF